MQKPSQHSLAQRALERVRGIAAGNAINPATITLQASEEAEYILHGTLQLAARWEVELASAAEVKNLPANPLNSMKDLQQAAADRPFPTRWWQDVLDELKNSNGTHGAGGAWGADNLTVTLPQYSLHYKVHELCRACAGQKWVDCTTCDGTGLEWCWHCNRTGREPANPQQPCTICLGEQKAECRTCNGQRKISCTACNGRGSKNTSYAMRLVANSGFSIKAGPELPTALRRAIDRAGVAKLANGHATITQLPATEDINPSVPKIQLTATIPFASIRLQIGAETYTAEVLGHRTAILEMKPFLDAPVIAALNSGTLPQLRVFKEAQAVAARRGSFGDFARGYPVGLSRGVAEQVYQQGKLSLRALLQKPRLHFTGVAVAVAMLLSCFYFLGPLRYWSFSLPFAHPMTFDLLLPALPALLYIFALQWWTSKKLAVLLGQGKNKGKVKHGSYLPPLLPRIAWFGIAAMFLLHWALMILQPQPPEWYLYHKLLLEAQLFYS